MMRIRARDLLWICVLGLAALFFLNIFIHPGLPRHQLVPQPRYRIPELNQDDEPLVSSSEDIPLARDDVGGLPLPFELRGTIIGGLPLAFIYDIQTDKRAVYKLN
ncbi:MAG: hypothetical protein AABZ27_07830, partial [Candidatus Omnitrophota bacterium]